MKEEKIVFAFSTSGNAFLKNGVTLHNIAFSFVIKLIIFSHMQKMRAHSLQTLLVVLISLGISINIMRITTYSHASQSFANWLSTVVKENGKLAKGLNSKIKTLENSKAELHQLIAEASVLVSKHSQAFSLPVPTHRSDDTNNNQSSSTDADTDTESESAPAPDPQTIFNLLISEWNSSENHNAMRELSVHKGSNWGQLFTTDQLFYNVLKNARQIVTARQTQSAYQKYCSFCSRWIIPFASGIAIGAP